jgi:hypothetical protein
VGADRGRDVFGAAGVRGQVLGLVSRGRLPRHVDDGGRPVDEGGKRPGVPDVALHERDVRALQPGHVVRAPHERAHAVARGEERVRDVAADKARAAGQRDEVALAHRRTLSQG